jgi:2',3'-cyclic-nucleotide 2'-phosphodiesterase (5'-nucleotidase family)
VKPSLLALFLAVPLAAQQIPAGSSRPVDVAVADDKEIAAYLAPRTLEIQAEFSKVIAQAPKGLRRGPVGEENLLGYWACDAMRQAASKALALPVHAAFTNRGGLRQDLAVGPVTVGDIVQVMPFENELIVIELTGAELRQAVIEGLEKRGGEPLSGLKVSALGTPEKPELQVLLEDGQALDPKGTYRLATSDFLFLGGDSIPALRKGRRPFTSGLTLRQCFLDACTALTKAEAPLLPPAPGRYQLSASIREALRAKQKVSF